MRDKYTSNKISYIFEQILELLLIQIRSLYEEYNENYLDEFEINYRNDFRESINKILKEKNLDVKIEELLLLDEDPYGLDTTENEIKFMISDIFREIAIGLSTESMVIKDQWKKEQIENFTNEIQKLSKLIEKYKQEMITLHDNLEMRKEQVEREKEKNNNLKIEIENVIKKLDLTEQNLERNIKKSNEQISKYENKLRQSESQNLKLCKENEKLKTEKFKLTNDAKNLNEEKLILKDKVKQLEISIKAIQKETNNKQNDEYIYEINKLKKEKEHLKNGVDLLKNQNKEKENELRKFINEKEKIIIENKELSNMLSEKDKKIRQLQQKINKLSTIKIEPKLTMDEIKSEYNNVYKELFTKLKEIVAIDSNKTVGGQRIMPIVANINKDAIIIKSINDMSTFKTSLENLNRELYQLDDLFSRNGKESGIAYVTQKLKQLKDKI